MHAHFSFALVNFSKNRRKPPQCKNHLNFVHNNDYNYTVTVANFVARFETNKPFHQALPISVHLLDVSYHNYAQSLMLDYTLPLSANYCSCF